MYLSVSPRSKWQNTPTLQYNLIQLPPPYYEIKFSDWWLNSEYIQIIQMLQSAEEKKKEEPAKTQEESKTGNSKSKLPFNKVSCDNFG